MFIQSKILRMLSWVGNPALLAFCLLFMFGESTGRAQIIATNTNYVSFAATTFVGDENAGFANVDLIRTGDDLSQFVFVDITTLDGTARGGIDYSPFRGTVFFAPFQRFATVSVLLFDNFVQDGNKTVLLQLSNPFSAGLTAPTSAILTILDDESIAVSNTSGVVGFSSPSYSITQTEWYESNGWDDEPPGAELTITRRGGTLGRILVDWATTNLTAEPGYNYIATNGTVALDDFQMSAKILIRMPLIRHLPFFFTNGVADFFGLFDTENFRVGLTNVRPDPNEDPAIVQPVLGGNPVANVNIVNNDFGFSFERLHYTFRETRGRNPGGTGGVIRIPVRRSASANGLQDAVSVRYVINARDVINVTTGGDHRWNTFLLEAGSDYGAPFQDYDPPASDVWQQNTGIIGEARLEWGSNDPDNKDIVIPIINDDEVEFNEDLRLQLFKLNGETDGFINFGASLCTVKILFDDQPAGAVDRVWNPDFDFNTSPPFNSKPGANATVHAVAVQPDGKLVVGGDFTAVNATPRSRIARYLANGQLDTQFDPGTGADNFVDTIAILADGRILIGGGFNSVNGTQRNAIARLHADGSLDASFNPGLGANGTIKSIVPQPDGRIYITGDFTSYDGADIAYVARILADGRLDNSFKPVNGGPNGPVNSLATAGSTIDFERESSKGDAEDHYVSETGSTSGTIMVDFNSFTNEANSIRIYYQGNQIFNSGSSTGLVSFTVNYGPGTSTSVEFVVDKDQGGTGRTWFYHATIFPVSDSRPVIGGNFTAYDGVTRNFIARLNLDGSLDKSFDPGSGADDIVFAVAKQGNKVILGGAFQTIDFRRRGGVARLNENGSLDLGFETGSGANNAVYAITLGPSGKPLLGGVFTSVNGTRRIGLARLNLDGAVDTTFMDTAYNQFAGLINPYSPENPLSQENFIRSMATYQITNLTFFTNLVETNIDVVTNGITNNILVTNEIIRTNIGRTEKVFVGGKFERVGGGFRRDDIRNRFNVARLIGGGTPGPGNIQFSQDVYSIDENVGQYFVTLIRTNGTLGQLSANFATADPPAGAGVARSGQDYSTTTRTPVWRTGYDVDRQFSSAIMGPNNRTVNTNRQRDDFTFYTWPDKPGPRFNNSADDDVFVSILDDSTIEGDEVFNMNLTTPDGTRLFLGGEPIPLGAALGRSAAQLIIIDNDFNAGILGFGSPTYTVNENAKTATINVTRVGGVEGVVTVDYATSDATAIARQDYLATRGTLTFNSGITNVTFTVPILDDTAAEFEKSLRITLSNPTGFPANVPPNQRIDTTRATTTLTIIDNDFAYGRISFDAAVYTVSESDGLATVTVKRSGGNLGDLVVAYATSAGSAIPGVSYVETAGTLHWVDGETTPKSFTVRLLDNQLVESDKTFNLTLSNPIVQGVPNNDALGGQPTATVRIVNDDLYGAFSFSQSNYDVDENGGRAIITVLRNSGVAGSVSVDFTTTNITAQPGVDYTSVSGTLNFEPGQTSASFEIQIIDNKIVTGDRALGLILSRPILGSLGTLASSALTIRDDELQRVPAGSIDSSFSSLGTDGFIYTSKLQPDGGILLGGDFSLAEGITRTRLARVNSDGSLDRTFGANGGPNGPVRTMAVEDGGRILIGGFFTSITATNRNYVARLNFDGAVDPTFNPGAGPDNPVYSLALQADGKVVIGGDFTRVNGTSRAYVARLNTNGVVDFNFDPGSGANKTIYAVVIQNDGKILVAGDFSTFNGQRRGGIARLNRDGSLDTTFDTGGLPGAANGATPSIRSLGVQSDGKILVGGLFNAWPGAVGTIGNVVRLNRDGTLDATFDTTKGGAFGSVQAIAFQIDGKILLGGDFTRYNGVTRGRITRLLSNGANDPAINFGTGANSTVAAIVLQPDRKIILAGGFTAYDDKPHPHLARIHGGSIDGSGAIEFSKPFFSVVEGPTNAVVEVHRTGGTFGAVTINYTTLPGTADASRYTPVSGTISFPEGETFQTFKVFVSDDNLAQDDATINLALSNPTGGAILGLQPTATINLLNDDSQIGFTSANYTITENFFTGSAAVTVQRTGSTVSQVAVTVLARDGTAVAGQDYTSVTLPLTFLPGERSKTLSIPITEDLIVEPNETINLFLTNIVEQVQHTTFISGLDKAVLTIVDNDFAAGSIQFAKGGYSELEGAGQAVITVRRTNGFTGSISANYRTVGGTAIIGTDYLETSGVVSFEDGVIEKTFPITLLNDELVETNKTIVIELSNPTGGATILPPTRVTLTIVDDDKAPGSVDETFNPGNGANATVRAIQFDDSGRIVIGGDFSTFNDVNRSHVARLSGNGGLDTSFDPGFGPNNNVVALSAAADGSSVLIGGAFSTVNDAIRNRMAKLTGTGALDTTFNLPLGLLNGQVNVVVPLANGKVLIGGAFDRASAAGRSRIARLNADGTLDSTFDPGVGPDSTVNAIALQADGRILIGGSFNSVSGVAYPGIARLGPNGAVDTSFRPTGVGLGGVNAVAVLDTGKILIAGDFTSTGAQAAQRLARLNADGSIDTTFKPFGVGPNRAIYAMAIQPDGKIVVGGDFSQVDSVERNRVARFNTDGSLDSAFDPGSGPDGRVLGIAFNEEGKIVIIGAFKNVNNFPRAGIARLFGDPNQNAKITISNVSTTTSGVTFNFSSQRGVRYAVESSTDLKTWTTLQTITASGEITTVNDGTSQKARFYRVHRLR